MRDFLKGLAVVAFSGVLFSTSAKAQELEPFTIGFAIDSMVQQIPYHVAREYGYFKDEGLDVSFEYFDGSSATIQQIVAGNVDAGSPSAGALFNAVVQGHELKQIFSFQYKSVFALATPASSGVKDVTGLKGKAIGVSELSGGEVPVVRAAIRVSGLVEGEDVRILPIGDAPAMTVNALQTNQVQAYSSNMFDIAAIEAAGIDMIDIMPSSMANFPGNSLVAREEVLNEKRKQFEGFTRAMARAVVYVAANRDEAYALAAKLAPEEFENETLGQASFDAAITLRERPSAMEGQPIGAHYMPGTKAYHDFMRQGSEEEGALPRDIDLEALLDTSLLEPANKFDHAKAALPRAQQ